MKCPKCNIDTTEDMLVCPNCKKVLKLACPKCKAINKSNVCGKCGFTIITKCHKCGKVNQTINSKCSKCGFSTYTSVAINSSKIDEFACLTIEFPNLSDIKPALGSTKLAEKFKVNLDKLISNYLSGVDLSREIIDNLYVIRFNKDESFSKSANSAMNVAIEILNLVTELNFKLDKLKNVALECKMAVLKRDINSKPEEYKSGFDIKLINQDKNSSKLLKSLQIITDSYIYEQVCDNYDLNSLSASFVKNEMIMFFELSLKKYIKIPKPKKEEKGAPPLAKFNIFDDSLEKEGAKNDIYNVDAITFNELKCTFIKHKSIDLIPAVVSEFRQNRKKVISIKSKKDSYPQTGEILDAVKGSKIFSNVLRVTCYDEMKYKPYGFFSELISSIYNFTQCPKNITSNKFDMFKEVDPSGFIKDLINLSERTFPHPEDVRYSLFDIFLELCKSMSQTLIYIENFENIDDTSHEVLQLFFEKFNEFDISYLVIANKDFPLHKNSHFLLANPNYIEMTATITPFKEIIEKEPKKYQEILDSYYLRKIAQNTKGNLLYFKNAVDYLLEKQLFTLENGVLGVANFENILIPPTLDELIVKRLNYLEQEEEGETTYKLFGMLLLIGPRIDLSMVRLLQNPNQAKEIQKLVDKKYIYVHENAIYIQNYNLYKINFISGTPQELKKSIAKEVLEKVFASSTCHPSETTLYKILEQDKSEFITWENLSRLNASMGDFSAYLNCSVKFLKLLDNHVNEDSEKTIEEYKMEVYENISNLLYKYKPNEIHNIAQIILNNLEKKTNDKKVINLCNKMLQGCLIGGNYSYALELLHKIFSRFINASMNPVDSNFNISFFLISMVKIEVMFSVGNLKDCVELGDEILSVITPENMPKLRPANLSEKQFEEVVFEAMSFVAISKVILLQDNLHDFMGKIKVNVGNLPKSFELFFVLEKIVKGIDVEKLEDYSIENSKFSNILISFISAFSEPDNDYKKFADIIYQAKINAKMHQLSQIELFCDLLIGFSYFKINQYKKASTIYYSVLEVSMTNGLKMVTYLAWYFISMLKFKQQDIEVALGIANNAIVQIERDANSGDFLFFLFRVLLSKILMAKNEQESAELCLNNAKFLKEKYGLKYNISLNSTSENTNVEETI